MDVCLKVGFNSQAFMIKIFTQFNMFNILVKEDEMKNLEKVYDILLCVYVKKCEVKW